MNFVGQKGKRQVAPAHPSWWVWGLWQAEGRVCNASWKMCGNLPQRMLLSLFGHHWSPAICHLIFLNLILWKCLNLSLDILVISLFYMSFCIYTVKRVKHLCTFLFYSLSEGFIYLFILLLVWSSWFEFFFSIFFLLSVLKMLKGCTEHTPAFQAGLKPSVLYTMWCFLSRTMRGCLYAGPCFAASVTTKRKWSVTV